jgi:hypothetical protein
MKKQRGRQSLCSEGRNLSITATGAVDSETDKLLAPCESWTVGQSYFEYFRKVLAQQLEREPEW